MLNEDRPILIRYKKVLILRNMDILNIYSFHNEYKKGQL